MDSLGDALVRLARAPRPARVRVDAEGRPRFVARTPSLDALVRLGFDQVRRDAVGHPTLAIRLLALLAAVRRAAERGGEPSAEAHRQARLLCERVAQATACPADARMVREVYERLHEHAGATGRPAR